MADDALKIVLRRRLAKLLFRLSNRSPRPIGDAESIEDEANTGDVRTSVELALVNGRRAPSSLREQSIGVTLGFKF